MKKSIITKEVEKGNGVYIIEVDKNKTGQIKGKDSWERLNNTIKEYLHPGKPSKTLHV